MKSCIVVGLISSVFLPILARPGAADVVYSLRYMEPGGKISRVPERRVFLSNAARWEENYLWHTWTYLKTIRLTQPDQKRVLEMNANLKMFAVAPLDDATTFPAGGADVKITDLGEEEVLGFKTRHYRVDMKLKIKLDAPDADFVSRQELWIAPPSEVKGFPANFPLTAIMPLNSPSFIGDVEVWNRLQSGLPVRSTLLTPDKADPLQFKEVYTEEVSSLSRGEIDPALFAVPGDYKEVSAEAMSRAVSDWSAKSVVRDVAREQAAAKPQ